MDVVVHDTRARALSHRVILNIGVKEFKLYADTNEQAILFMTLIRVIEALAYTLSRDMNYCDETDLYLIIVEHIVCARVGILLAVM